MIFTMKQPLLIALACLALGCSQPATKTTAIVTSASSVPGADVINAETCVDIPWLLTHYDVTRLASGSSPAEGTGYPLACCADGVLKPDDTYRCEIDWPSSDVIECDTWTAYHDQLAAAHPEGARSPRVSDNLAALKRWPTEQHHCTSKAASLSASLVATERRTLTLFPRDLSYDDANGVVIFAPHSGVKRAAYITYTLSMESFQSVLAERPTAPVKVIVALQAVTRKTERAAPGHAEPTGGFNNVYYTGAVIGTP
jgi:hypothetical protein